MPIANVLQPINIGQPNNPANSDSLYTAFTTIQENFEKLSEFSSNISEVVGGVGINVVTDPTSNVVTVTSSGVTQLIPGSGVILNPASGVGNVTVSFDPTGANITAGILSVGVLSPNSTLAVANTPVSGSGARGNISIDLATVPNLTAATYRNPNVTVDTYGRVTNIANGVTPGTLDRVTINGGLGIATSSPGPVGNTQTFTVTNTGVISISAGEGILINGTTQANANGSSLVISAIGGGGGGGAGTGTVTYVGLQSNTFLTDPPAIRNFGTFTIDLPVGWTWDNANRSMAVSNTITASNIFAITSTGMTGGLRGTLDANSNSQANITTLGVLTGLLTDSNSVVNLGNSLVVVNTATFSNGINVAAGPTTLSGNLTAVNGTFNGNLTVLGTFAATLEGDGGRLSNIRAANIAANSGIISNTVISGNYSGITNVGTLVDLTVAGNTMTQFLTVNNQATFSGVLTSATANIANATVGNLTLTSALNVSNAIISGNTTTGNLTVTSNANIGGNLVVNADITTSSVVANGDITAANTVITNGVYIGNVGAATANSLIVNAYAAFNNTSITLNGSILLNDNATLDADGPGTVLLANTTNINGVLTANSNVFITANTPANNTSTGALQVAGGGSLLGNLYTGGELGVSGNAVVNFNVSAGTLLVAGTGGVAPNSRIMGNLFVSNGIFNISNTSALTVEGDSTFNGSPTFAADSIFNANATFNSGLVANIVSLAVDLPNVYPAVVNTITLDANGNIDVITLSNIGRGYSTPPAIQITGGNTTPAVIDTTLDANGSVSTIVYTNRGSGYNINTIIGTIDPPPAPNSVGITSSSPTANYTLVLPANAGSNGQALLTNGTGTLRFGNVATTAGTNTQVQYNDAGSLAGSAAFTFNQSTNTVSATNLAVSGVANLQGETTIANLQATVTANTNNTIGNLVTVTINGVAYQLLAK